MSQTRGPRSPTVPHSELPEAALYRVPDRALDAVVGVVGLGFFWTAFALLWPFGKMWGLIRGPLQADRPDGPSN